MEEGLTESLARDCIGGFFISDAKVVD